MAQSVLYYYQKEGGQLPRKREERKMTKYENREIEEMVPEWYEDLEAVMQEMADQEEAK